MDAREIDFEGSAVRRVKGCVVGCRGWRGRRQRRGRGRMVVEGHYRVWTWWSRKSEVKNKTSRRQIQNRRFDDALSETFYTRAARPRAVPLSHQSLTLYVFLAPFAALTAQHHRHTRPPRTRRHAPLVSRRDRTQQAPHRHCESIHLSPVHVSYSPRSQ